MVPTASNSIRLLILALGRGLVAVAVAALACGPSAPAGQDDSTPEPTATATPTPTPTPTTAPEADQAKLSPEVNAVLGLHAEAASEGQGNSERNATGSSPPERIDLYISTKRNYNEPIKRFLVDNGATVTRAKEGPSGQHYHSGITAEVPVSLISALSPGLSHLSSLMPVIPANAGIQCANSLITLPVRSCYGLMDSGFRRSNGVVISYAIALALSRQPGFSYAFTDYARYDKLSYELSNLVMLYKTGAITTLEGAERSQAQWSGELLHVSVCIESCEDIPGVVDFLHSRLGRNPWWYDRDAACYGSAFEEFGALDIGVLSSDLVQLSLRPGVTSIIPVTREPTGRAVPPFPFPPLSFSRGSNSVGQQTIGTAAAARGSDAWSQDGTGRNIGIIDSGFTGISALMGNGLHNRHR